VRNSGRPGRGFYRRGRPGGELTQTMAMRRMATAQVRLAGMAASGDETGASRGVNAREDGSGASRRAARTVRSRAEHGGDDAAAG
jgi:hypothetical protein